MAVNCLPGRRSQAGGPPVAEGRRIVFPLEETPLCFRSNPPAVVGNGCSCQTPQISGNKPVCLRAFILDSWPHNSAATMKALQKGWRGVHVHVLCPVSPASPPQDRAATSSVFSLLYSIV